MANFAIKNPPGQFRVTYRYKTKPTQKGNNAHLANSLLLGDFPSRFSEKVVYILHVFRVDQICFILLSLPFAESKKMVPVFTSPHRINIRLAVFCLAVVPGGYSLRSS